MKKLTERQAERCAFERWAKDRGYVLSVWYKGMPNQVYAYDGTESVWQAWQSSARRKGARGRK